MPQVAVQINGKTYRMACDEGQEAHLLDLARRFDQTIDQLKESFGEIGDQRLTVMAGVMVTDELVALQHEVIGLESELAKIRTDRISADPDREGGGEPDREKERERETQIAEALTKTAERIESISEKLTSDL